ncbi:hypothetical protein J6590_061486 [Homalodisca vitripennis]|nr:hypothetical protein J6590_061486 [Homalodisca vitripennis]
MVESERRCHAQFFDIMSHATRGLQQRCGVEVPAVGNTRPAVPNVPPPLLNPFAAERLYQDAP